MVSFRITYVRGANRQPEDVEASRHVDNGEWIDFVLEERVRGPHNAGIRRRQVLRVRAVDVARIERSGG